MLFDHRILILFWYWIVLLSQNVSHRVRVYLRRVITLGATFIVTLMIGVFLPSTAEPIFLLELFFLGPLLIFWVAYGVLTLDIAQEILPEKKKNEIKSTQIIMQAAGFILFLLSMLLIPIFWHIPHTVSRWMYLATEFCWLVFGLLMYTTAPKTLKLAIGGILIAIVGTNLFLNWTPPSQLGQAWNFAQDTAKVGILYTPAKPSKMLIIKKVRDFSYDQARKDQTMDKPDTYARLVSQVETIGGHGYQATMAEHIGLATADGLRLLERPDTSIQANLAEWQMVSCLNVSTNRYEPCEFFPGDIIEGFGTITNDHLRLIANDQIVQIGPCGITDRTKVTMPFVTSLPRFALLGQMVDTRNNSLGQPFAICSGYQITGHGYLSAMVNGDYFYCYSGCDKGQSWPHPEWFNSNRGTFGIRIRRNNAN